MQATLQKIICSHHYSRRGLLALTGSGLHVSVNRCACSPFYSGRCLRGFQTFDSASIVGPHTPHYDSRQVAAAAVRANGSRAGVLKLVLYSKPDCHLCHGLKEKIDTAILKAKFMPSELSDAEVEVRDITTNPEWERQYAMVIPVLTVVAPGSKKEVKVRRVPPRSNSDKVAKHILSAVTGDEDIED